MFRLKTPQAQCGLFIIFEVMNNRLLLQVQLSGSRLFSIRPYDSVHTSYILSDYDVGIQKTNHFCVTVFFSSHSDWNFKFKKEFGNWKSRNQKAVCTRTARSTQCTSTWYTDYLFGHDVRTKKSHYVLISHSSYCRVTAFQSSVVFSRKLAFLLFPVSVLIKSNMLFRRRVKMRNIKNSWVFISCLT